jgi:hypothetical protein
LKFWEKKFGLAVFMWFVVCMIMGVVWVVSLNLFSA